MVCQAPFRQPKILLKFSAHYLFKINMNKIKIVWIGREKYSRDNLDVSFELELGIQQIKLFTLC